MRPDENTQLHRPVQSPHSIYGNQTGDEYQLPQARAQQSQCDERDAPSTAHQLLQNYAHKADEMEVARALWKTLRQDRPGTRLKTARDERYVLTGGGISTEMSVQI
jgi:hypothetical protein